MKTKWEPGSTKSLGLWPWTSVAVILLLPYIFCLPIQPRLRYYEILYQNKCPLLPRFVGDGDSDGFIRNKFNYICDGGDKRSSPPSPIHPCKLLVDLFPKLCNLSSRGPSVPAAVNNTLNRPIDHIEVDALGLATFCGRFVEAYRNVSRSDPENWLNPFQSENGVGVNDTKSCESVCKNVVVDVHGKDEVEVSMPCMLLSEGYIIYQQQTEINSAKVSQPPVPGPEEKPEVDPKPISGGENKDSPTSAKSVPQPAPKQALPPQAEKQTIFAGHNREGVGSGSADNVKEDVGGHAGDKSKPGSALVSQKVEGVEANNQLKPSPDKRTEAVNNAGSTDKTTDLKTGSSSGKPLGVLQGALALSPSSSTTSTTSTPASVDANNGEGYNDIVPPPPAVEEEDQKAKSSTSSSSPINAAVKKPDKVDGDTKPQEEKVPGNNAGLPIVIVDSAKDEKTKGSSSKKVVDDDETEAIPELPADEYDSGEVGVGAVSAVKPPTRKSDTEVVADTKKDVLFEQQTNYNKPSKSQGLSNSNFEFSAGMPFEGRTTINLSVNETEESGFFNYFLFCATLVGLMYVVFHNKKKLIAYVVEGRRPRGRSRRSSADREYRRLENNYDE